MGSKQIDGLVQYPCDAESDSFFAALSTALVHVLGYSEEIPFWCSPKGAYCTKCGSCGQKTVLQKHQISMYHALLTATGVAFGFDYPEDDSVAFHTLDGVDIGWRWPDAFLQQVMGIVGLTWQRISHDADESTVYKAIVAAIDAGNPVLIRLGGRSVFPGETEWQVVTGYQDGALCGLDSSSHTLSDTAQYSGGLFLLKHWFESFADAIIITGHCEKTQAYFDVLERIYQTLCHPSHIILENDIMAMLDGVTPDNAEETAGILYGIASVPIEARWHAAEAFASRDNLLSGLTEDQELKNRVADLFFSKYLADNHNETHGVCWKIWQLLGVGAVTGYSLAPDSAGRLLEDGVRSELKRLFGFVFDNDKAVAAGLADILNTYRDEKTRR